MLTKNTLIVSLTIGVLVTLGLALSAAGGSALAVINDKIETKDKSLSIYVSPASSDRITLTPGDVYDGEFTVTSDASVTNEVFVSLTPYSIGKDSGQRDFDTETSRTHITKWIDFGVDGCDITRTDGNNVYFTMRPQEECKIKYHIAVPSDAMGGSQNSGIFVQSVVDDSSGGMIMQSYRVGYLLYVNINGPGALYRGEIVKNDIPFILFEPPVYAGSLIENTGNLDFRASYEVVMHNWFGGEEVFRKSWENLIMADGRKSDEAQWGGSPSLGIFKVQQKISLLDEVSDETKIVIIIPIWLIIITVLLIAALIWWLCSRNHGKPKRSKRWN
ncbi:MAG: hypothetical protein LBK50_02325 [Candidatus Nomurabacteria bacterium]|jgi:hypothetical protein|nr:hypothetical protein [Candidatus Nomurabacteria bacterium]